MNLVSVIKNKSSRAAVVISKHAPELLIGAGIAGSVAATIFACKATLKLDEIIDEHKAEVDRLKEGLDKYEEYKEEDYKKDMLKTYVQTTKKVVKLYAPSVVLGVSSIAAILGSHKMLSARCIALSTTLSQTFDDFKSYRQRVIDDLGKDADLKYRFGAKDITVTELKEDGKEITKNITLLDDRDISPFAKFFDEGCIEWTKDPEYNMATLLLRQEACNEQLKAKGHLFLNEVYDILGIPRTSAGQIYGWIYDPNNNNIDSYVDFGIYKTCRANRNFVNGYEPVILLDFNVDGNIINKI